MPTIPVVDERDPFSMNQRIVVWNFNTTNWQKLSETKTTNPFPNFMAETPTAKTKHTTRLIGDSVKGRWQHTGSLQWINQSCPQRHFKRSRRANTQTSRSKFLQNLRLQKGLNYLLKTQYTQCGPLQRLP